MNVFASPDFDEHEHVSFFRDEESGLRAIIAIHNTAPFRIAGGGCRMWPYASDEAALRDALRLSRAMSYKLVLCDLPAGGAKCVVIGDPAIDKSEALLRALGRAVERLGGRFIIAEDVGTTPEDMRIIGKETRHVVGKETDTGGATAYGAFVALRTAVAHRMGRTDLHGLTVAVQGLGNVGGRLCRHLAEAGAKLIVSDVRAEVRRRYVDELGAVAVASEDIYDVYAEVFAPCALGAILDDRTIPRLRCQVIAGAANNQLAEDRHATLIAERGILFAPDFINNAGGVIGASQEGRKLLHVGTSYDERLAFREAERIADLLLGAFHLAERDGLTPYAAAIRIAKDKIRALRHQSFASAARGYLVGRAKERLGLH